MKILRSILPVVALALISTRVAFAACTPISMAPSDVTAGTVQTPYTLTFTASGSAATPLAYEVTSGVLPGGLSLDGVTGAVTGSPTTAGNFPITLTATDTAGCSGGRAYELNIAQGNQTISFTSTAPAAATVGGPTYAVAATATSGLPVTFTIDASAASVCSIAGSTVSFIGVGTCVIDANQAGNASYTAAPQVQQSFGVAQGTQTITFTSTAPAAASVGGPTYNVTATATSGLPVTFTIDATATSVCSITGSTVSFLASGTCVIDANQAGDANYSAAPQVQQTFGVGKSTQTITFTSTAPAAASVGGATYNVTATASSGLTVAFTIDATASTVCSITGSTVSFIGAGSCVIDANQAGDINYNPAPQVQQTFTVAKGSQTITYTSTAPAAATVGGATYTVTATASSGLPVTFTIDATATTVCSITGSTVSFIGAGTCVIDANQAGDANYNAAPQVQQSFAVAKGNQTVSFTSTAPAGATVGGPTYTVTATATSGLSVALTIDATAASVCSIAGSTVSFIGVGTCVIDANQAGNANYNAAAQVQQTFAVGQGTQTITFTSTAPASATVGGPTYTVTATASSGLPVTFTIDATATAVCSIAGSTVSFIGAGTCVIDANQAGNANYLPAPQVQQSFGVSKTNQTITFTSVAPAGASVAGPTYTVTATATSGLPVTFTIDATATGVCSIAGSTVSFIGAGTCVIDANQAGNGSFNPAPQVQQSFAVAKGNQTISYTSIAPATAAVGGPAYTVSATATSGLPVTFTIDASAVGVCSIAGSTVSFIGAGTCVIDANQAGNANYNAAPQAQQSFAVAKGNQTISFTSTAPAGAQFNGPTYTVTANATSGLPVTFTIDATATSVCSIAGSTVSFIGVGTCVIDANQAGNANYNAAPQVQQSFAVAKATQTISFTSTPPSPALVTGTYTVTATATSGLAVTFTIDATATSVCSIAGSLVTFNAGGTCVIDANQAGNANYNAATQAQQSFLVTKNNQTITFTSTAPVNAKVGGPTYTVTATATSGLPVTFTIDAASAGACTIAGSVVSFVHATTCIIDANQAGNGAFNAAPQVQQTFAIAKGDQTLNVTSTAPTFGSATAAGAPHTYVVAATASSGLAITVTIDAASTVGACSAAGTTVTYGANAGNCLIDINQPGNADWNPAPQVQQSTTVEIPATAAPDSHTVTGNVVIAPAAANGVLTNDAGTNIAITTYGVNGTEVSSGATPTSAGGSVTLNIADGSYTFTPKANFNGTDTFKYTLANHVSSVVGTVSLIVSDRIMVVTTGGGGSCMPASPCALGIADAALSVSPSIDLVYVEGGTYNTATFSMTSNQKLVGGAVDLNTAIADAAIAFAPDSVVPANIAVTARPAFNNSANVISLAGLNLVEYFNINPSGGSAILGNAVAANSNTLHDITIAGTGGANGVNLTNNTGATFNFSNFGVTTASGNAFSATGGGTVNATQNNTTIVNTLSTSTGTALNIANTTIGASGLTFRSITSNGSSGNAGIVLDTTGASGGLTVTGNGGSCVSSASCTGGTISNKTGANTTTYNAGNGIITLNAGTPVGIGIVLRSTQNVSLTRMQLNDFTNYAVFGQTVVNFTLDNSVVNGTSGDTVNVAAASPPEGSIFFTDLTGNAAITNSTVTDLMPTNSTRITDTIHVMNNGGNLTLLNIDTCTIANTTQAVNPGGKDAIFFGTPSGSGSGTMNLTINNTNVTAAFQFLLQLNLQGSASSTVNVTNSHFTDTNENIANGIASAGGGINLTGGGTDVYVKYLFQNNTFQHNSGANPGATNAGALLITGIASQTGTFDGRIVNNTFGATGILRSGSGNGADALRLFASGNNGSHGNTKVLVQGNSIKRYGETGIQFNSRQGNAGMDITVLGNTINEPGSAAQGAFAAIWANVGALAADTNSMNIAIGSTSGTDKNTMQDSDPSNATDVFLDSNSCASCASKLNVYRNGSAAGGSGEALVRQILVDDNNPTLDLLAGFTNGSTIVIQPGLPPQPSP